MIAATFVVGALAVLLAIKHAPSRHPHSIYFRMKGRRE